MAQPCPVNARSRCRDGDTKKPILAQCIVCKMPPSDDPSQGIQWQGCNIYGVHLSCVERIPDVQRALSHFTATGEVSCMNELKDLLKCDYLKCDLDCGCRWDVKNLTSFVDWLCAADARTWKPIVSGKAGNVCICAGCLINWGNMRLMDVDQQPILPECVKNVKDVPTWDLSLIHI